MADTAIEFNHSFKGGRNKKRLQKTEGQGKEPVKISTFPCGVNKTKQNLCFEIKQNSVPPHLMIKLIDGTVYRARAGLRSRENGTEPPHARVSSCVSRALPGHSFFSRNCRTALRVETVDAKPLGKGEPPQPVGTAIISERAHTHFS